MVKPGELVSSSAGVKNVMVELSEAWTAANSFEDNSLEF